LPHDLRGSRSPARTPLPYAKRAAELWRLRRRIEADPLKNAYTDEAIADLVDAGSPHLG
jgi:hypothetical protein